MHMICTHFPLIIVIFTLPAENVPSHHEKGGWCDGTAGRAYVLGFQRILPASSFHQSNRPTY